MPKIPTDLLEDILSDPFYLKCCISGNTPVQLHHNLNFGGRSINEKWCILPLHKSIHDMEKRKDIKEKLDWIMLNRADDITLRRFSKAIDYIARREYLNTIYAK